MGWRVIGCVFKGSFGMVKDDDTIYVERAVSFAKGIRMTRWNT